MNDDYDDNDNDDDNNNDGYDGNYDIVDHVIIWWEWVITIARDYFPLVVSILDYKFFQGRVTSFLSIGSKMDLGFVYLVCRENLNNFHVCFGLAPKGLSEGLL